MNNLPFNQRYGLESSKPITESFPDSAILAFGYFFEELEARGVLQNYIDIRRELLRTSRLDEGEFDHDNKAISLLITGVFRHIKWWQIYVFLERIYKNLLTGVERQIGYDEWEVSELSEVKKFFTREVNNILAEENIAFQFESGEFVRRGRAQTQKSIKRVGTVLSDPKLFQTKIHYSKALEFFHTMPIADAENCVKEALCAIEACLEALTEKPASRDFKSTVRKLQGNEEKQIPSPVAEGMIKLHAYRGSGKGIAHAAIDGNKVTVLEAELVLNISADYITYLADLLSEPEREIPF